MRTGKVCLSLKYNVSELFDDAHALLPAIEAGMFKAEVRIFMRTIERDSAPVILFFRYSVLAVFTVGLLALIIAAGWMVNLDVGYWTWSSGYSEEKIGEPFDSEDLAVVRRTGGVVVWDVDPLAPAEKAGIKAGDTIVAVNGALLRDDPRAYFRALVQVRPGDTLSLDVKRIDSVSHHILVLEDRFKLASSQGYLGVQTRWLTKQMADSLHLPCSTGVLVVGVEAETPAEKAGLRANDIIVTYSGQVLTSDKQFLHLIRSTAPGTTVDIRIQRNADTLTVQATLSGWPTDITGYFYGSKFAGSPATVIWLRYLPRLLVVFLLLVVGSPIGWLRPKDAVAFLCSVLFLCIGMAIASLDILPYFAAWPGWAMFIALSLEYIGVGLYLPLSVSLISVFPVPTRLGRTMRKWVWIAFNVCGFQALVWWAYELGKACGYTWGGLLSLPIVSTFVGLEENVYFLVTASLLISVLIAQRIENSDRPQARLKILELGFAITFGALLLLSVRDWMFGFIPEGWLPAYGYVVYYVPFILFSALPLSLAYTVLARKVFGIRFIIRRGLQHLLLSKGVLVLEGIIVFLIVLQMMKYRGSGMAGSVTASSGIALGSAALAMVVLRTVNRKLMPVIDRRFFRETCDARRLLLDLGDQLAKLHDRDRILQRTAATVMKALHPARVIILLRADQATTLQCALSLQNGHSRAVSLEQLETAAGHDSSIVLDVQDGVVRQLADDKPWVSVSPETLDSDRGDEARLLKVNCELLLTLEGSSGLLGIMGLGGKLSEEPYSREDRELLLSVARQMGMTLENTELLEIAKHEAQMSRDVEIARTVQQNLFPHKLPVSAGWEFAGFCRPARAVGGDYYDIFEPIPGKVLIALGDVSGKGVGASLLMASVHAAIRSRAGSLGDKPAALIAEVNRHLTATCPQGTFVTLFFGTLDVDSGILQYVNCGHPPAILWHGDGRGAEQLAEGGPVLGIIDADVFAAGECQLVSGDTVIVYSDGVTEAMNASEEMFEDERLIEAVAGAANRSAPDLMTSIVKAVDDFAEKQEQADDISVLVVRRCV